MNKNDFMATLTKGFAATQTARGAQNHLSAAGQRSPVFAVSAPQVGGQLFASPNAIRSAPPPTTNGLFSQPVRAAVTGK